MNRLKIVLRGLFRKDEAESQFNAELMAYIDHAIDDKIAGGMAPEEARRAALIESGGVEQVKESVRSSRPAAWVDSLAADFKYAARTLWVRRSFSTIAVLTIALGIGAAATMFTVVDHVLLRPLKHKNSDRLVTVWGTVGALKTDTVAGSIWNRFTLSYEDYEQWLSQQTVFEETALFAIGKTRFLGDQETRTIAAGEASANLFAMLGTTFFRGRSFTNHEPDAIVVTYEFWKTALGAVADPVGRRITLDQTTGTIVGVLAPHFDFAGYGADAGPNPELWRTVRTSNRTVPDYEVIGRLRAGVPLPDAQRETDGIFHNLRFAFLNELATLDKRHGAHLESRKDTETGAARTSLLILFLSSGLLLLIACGNVGNLLLGESLSRQHEFAMRSALGATSLRILRQLTIESVLLAVVGGLLGSALAWLGVRCLVGLRPTGLPRIDEIVFDFRVWVIAMMAAAATGVVFGLGPAMGLARVSLMETLKIRGRRRGFPRSPSQSAVVIAEVSICFVLLVGAGLLTESLRLLGAVDTGIRSDGLVAVKMSLPRRTYQPGQIFSLYRRLFTELNAIPGVTEVSAASAAPFEDYRALAGITINGAPAVIENRSIGNNYFETVGGRIIEGRPFSASELSNASPVMIINETMGRTFWPGESAVNKHIKLVDRMGGEATIVGVSADVRQLGPAVSPAPMYYTPLNAETDFTVLLRTAQNPSSITPVLRTRIRTIDQNIAVNWIQPMQDLINASFAEQRYRALLINIFAAAAVGLAVVGLYSVMSRYVSYRAHEFAVRVAVGAKPQSILRLILRKGLLLTFAGICIGAVMAAGLTRILTDDLFGVSALDASTYTAVALLLVIVSLLAVFAPALRACRIDPIQCLRGE